MAGIESYKGVAGRVIPLYVNSKLCPGRTAIPTGAAYLTSVKPTSHPHPDHAAQDAEKEAFHRLHLLIIDSEDYPEKVLRALGQSRKLRERLCVQGGRLGTVRKIIELAGRKTCLSAQFFMPSNTSTN
jgi:hypothetical protein